MKKRLICLLILAALFISVCGALSACTVKTVVQNPYESVYIINPYMRLAAYDEPQSLGLDTLEITLAKNEGEGAQLCVYSKTQEYKNMQISVSNLEGQSGNVLPSASIELFREEYVNFNGKTGEYFASVRDGSAQILVPLTQYPEFNTFDTTAGKNLIYYIKATTDESTPAGTYTGKITLTYDGGQTEVPFKITVLDFTLSERAVLRSDLLYWADFTNRYYGPSVSDEYKKEFYDETLRLCRENKLNVTNAYDVPIKDRYTPEEYGKQMKAFLEKNPSVNTFSAPIFWSATGNFVIDTERTVPYLDALRNEGILSMAIVNSVDEPDSQEEFDALNNIGAWIDANYPELKSYCCIIPSVFDASKVNEGALDIWCYTYPGCTVAQLKEGQTGAKEIWGYAFDKTAYNSISQVRLMGLECKKFDLGGIEDWCLNNTASTYDEQKKQWQMSTSAAYLYSYVFPAREGDDIVGKNMALPTLILEEFRDACEDYEYFIELEKLVSEKIDTLGLSLTIDEAMESYYDGLFLDVHRLPDNEEGGFMMVRNRVIDELQNGVPYILTTETDTVNWTTDNRYITIYAAAGEDIVFDGEKLQTTTEGSHSVAKLHRTIGSESKTYEIECGGKTTKQHILSKDFDKKLVVDLANKGLYDALKEANPNTSFELYKENGKDVLKITFDTSTRRGFVIPAECLENPVGSYNNIRFSSWADSDDNIYTPVFQLFSDTAQITAGVVNKEPPTTNSNAPFSEWFPQAEAKDIGAKLKSMRIRLDKSSSDPVTLYISDIYFIDESSSFVWEKVK